MCKLDRGTAAETVIDSHLRGFLGGINTRIHRLSKADGPPKCG